MDMILQLKDLASQKLITVPEEGLTFGREGGDAQVQVADMGVSKRHAEVFCEGGAWFLKDLGSSNGTMLANERIADATEILPGDVFQLSKRKFEVLKVVEDDGGGEEEEQDAPPMTEPERKAPAKPAPKAAAKSAPPPAKKPAAAKMAPANAPREPTRAAPAGDDDAGGGDDEMAKASVGQVLAGVPKAVAYYLVNVPLMLLNPFGTIRKAIEEQPKDPMGRMELIAWALPGNLFSGAMGFIAGLISQLIVGALSIGSLIGGLIFGAIGAVVGSVITGIIWHPLMTWLIAKLFKGESDARGRTNYFLQTQTAIIIAVLPSGLTIIIAALRARFGIPFIGVVPVLLSAVTGALSLFVAYKWFEHFQVVKWIKIVLLVLMGLTALGALAGIPGALSGGGGVTIASGSGGGDVDVGDVDDAQKQALDAMKAAGATAEQIKQAEDAYKASKAAMKAAAAATADAEKAAEDAKNAGEEAVKKGAEAVKKGKEDIAKAAEDTKEKVDAKKPPPPEDKVVEKPAEKPAEKPVAAAEPDVKPPPPAAIPSGNGYPSWHAKFENIEKRVTEDPTLLRKGSVLKLYQELQEETAEADAKVRKDYKKVDPKTLMHLRDAELFDTSGKTVDALHKELFGR